MIISLPSWKLKLAHGQRRPACGHMCRQLISHSHRRGSLCSAQQQRNIMCNVQQSSKSDLDTQPEGSLVGEDAAVFKLEQQSLSSWGMFGALLTGVGALLYAVWTASICQRPSKSLKLPHIMGSQNCPGLHMLINGSSLLCTTQFTRFTSNQDHYWTAVYVYWLQVWIAPGSGLGDDFVESIESLFSNSEFTILAILAIFALVHSGLAYLRPYGEHVMVSHTNICFIYTPCL